MLISTVNYSTTWWPNLEKETLYRNKLFFKIIEYMEIIFWNLYFYKKNPEIQSRTNDHHNHFKTLHVSEEKFPFIATHIWYCTCTICWTCLNTLLYLLVLKCLQIFLRNWGISHFWIDHQNFQTKMYAIIKLEIYTSKQIFAEVYYKYNFLRASHHNNARNEFQTVLLFFKM